MSDELKNKSETDGVTAKAESDVDEVDEKKIEQMNVDTGPESGFAKSTDDTEAVSEDTLRTQLEVANTQVEEFKDQFLRAKAESENARRRAQADVANARKFAVEDFAREMLSVKDSLDLARNVELSDADSEAVMKMLEGLDLTLRQMEAVFDRFSLQVVAPEPGDKFDPERHQAMTVQESADIPANHIVSIMQKGFMLHERLLRPAMVIVAKVPDNKKNA